MCGRTLDEVGGHRLMGTHNVGVWLESAGSKGRLGDMGFPLRAVRLQGKYKQVILCFQGNMWTEEAVQRAAEQAQAGKRPWVCQRCLKYALCGKCRHPLRWAFGTDTLHDDGTTGHQGVFPFKPPCTNPECPDWRDPTPHETKPS